MRDAIDQLQIFRALKSEIRSSPEYLIIGIDVGRTNTMASSELRAERLFAGNLSSRTGLWISRSCVHSPQISRNSTG